MAIFSESLKSVLRHEGGYVNDPDDRGGATNMGITLKTLAAWRNAVVTAIEVENLTVTEAGKIYKARYWDKMGLDGITSQKLAGAVMDFGVNAGVKTAGKALQRSVNWVRAMEDFLVVDGAIGPLTTRTVNTTTERILILRYFQERMRYYTAIARRRPLNRKFLYAWTRRALAHV